MRNARISALILFTALSAPGAYAGEHSATGACTESESWKLGRGLDARPRNEFEKSIHGETTPARGYAHAQLLERTGASEEARLLGTYWKGATLLKANLVHLAFEYFSQAASAMPSAGTLGVQTAAVECLNHLKLEYSALQAPQSVTVRLPQYFALAPKNRQPFNELAFQALQAGFIQHTSREEMTGTLSLLKGTGAYELLADGMAAASASDHKRTVQSLEAFLKVSVLTPALKKQLNPARMLLARAYYSLKDYENASNTYKRVDKSSNLFSETLSELAWAHLQDENYSEAIGIATNVQVGSLRTTFVPEAPMVLAMSLNELCQYPDSLRAIRKFQAEYRPSYSWLKKWAQNGGSRTKPLYPLAISYIGKKKVEQTVPDRVASEWIRSDAFIALQDEVSLSFKEERALKAMAKQVGEAKADFQSDQEAALVSVLNELGGRLTNESEAGARLRQDRVTRINTTLAAKSAQMLAQLDEIAENTKLIQVEIYNGASHDIIWQNANPEYHDVSRKWKSESKKDKAASRVWNWGTIRKSGDKVELWEDEMGAFKASLFDNCSNKQRYMALRTLPE